MSAPAALSDDEQRFDAARRRVGIFLAPAAFLLILALPPGDLSVEAHRLAAVAAATIIFWITEAIPLPVAALLGPAAAVMLGVAPAKQALAPFAHPLIFLFLGGFLLAGALGSQGFDRRAALWLMSRSFIQGKPARAAAAIAVLAWAFSMWISNTATTAMMIPIALGLRATMLRALPPDTDRAALDRFVGGMVLFMAYAASIGGVATPIGTGPNVIALGFLDEQLGVRFDFLQWMAFAFPTSLAFLIVLLFLGRHLFPSPIKEIEGLTREVKEELRQLGPMGSGERRALLVFAVAIAGWILPSVLRLTLGATHPTSLWVAEAFHEGVVAMVCACALFLIPSGKQSDGPILTWAHGQAVDWGTLLLLGGGIALGKLTFDTGLAKAIGESVFAAAGPHAASGAGLLIVATALVIFLTEVTSNTATTNMMLPVLIAIAQASGANPVPTALCVTMAASFAFMLPVSTPPNAMAYGTGLVRVSTMVRAGLRLDAIGLVLLVVVGLLLL